MGSQSTQYIYLHGFASSPNSAKVDYLNDRFRELDLELTVPDFNQGDFSHLTITRQLTQVASLFSDRPVTLIGSSLGGLTAAWLGEKYPQVERLVLIAPAFGFVEHWLPKLKPEELEQWQNSGYMPIYHYGEERSLPLHYQFITDAQKYPTTDLTRAVPTLICHGLQDEIIPLQASVDYQSDRPWAKLVQYDSDHTLMDVIDQIWQEIQQFCQLGSKI
jgi:uncharacterized protein